MSRASSTRPVFGELSATDYFIGLGLMFGVGVVALLALPFNPAAGMVCMLMVGILAVSLLQADAPRQANGKPVPSGASAMAALYEEIELETMAGRVYPFGSWSARHRARYFAWCAAHGIVART